MGIKKEIIINAEKHETRIAILENGELVELYVEHPENKRTIGDIYLGRVRRMMPNIKAAFVDIGQKQDAFLHFSDLTDNLPEILDLAGAKLPKRAQRALATAPAGGDFETDDDDDPAPKAPANGRTDEQPWKYLRADQKIVVKVTKEPFATKGSRISTDISMAGRFLVLVPMANYVAVSKKINSYKERKRLRLLAKSLLPEGFGVIVRTVAEGRDAKSLHTDLRLLVDKWNSLEKNLADNPNPPQVLYQDVNLVSSIIRDLFTEDYDRILVDDQRVYRNIRSYVNAVAPQMADLVKMHDGKGDVFAKVGIEKAVQQAFQHRVDLPGGGYLFIEHTEAMHVVDVNSGRAGRGLSQEENSLRVNVEAARMICRQLRLRDLGGIIAVDFIDLRDPKNRKKVYDEIKKEFKKDRAVTKVIPMSDFGVVQITRQRLRPSITTGEYAEEQKAQMADEKKAVQQEKAARRRERRKEEDDVKLDDTKQDDVMPAAQAAPAEAVERPSIAELLSQVDAWLGRYRAQAKEKGVILRVHPFTGAFLSKGLPSYLTRWRMKHTVRVVLNMDEDMDPTQYVFKHPKSRQDITADYAA